MSKIKKKILIILLSILLLPVIEAIGLLSPPIGTITYRPNYEEEFTFSVRNFNYGVDVSVGGDIAKYITMGPIIDQPSGLKQFTLKIKFPSTIDIEPGMHIFIVGVKETGSPGGMVGALTAVQKKFKVEVYSKERVIRADFDAPDANENEVMLFRINAKSVTYQHIALIMGRITIYDMENNILATFDTNRENLASGESKTLEAEWNNSILVPGKYRAEALVIYDGKTITLEDPFKIGTLMIKIRNYTDEFTSGQVNEFKLEVENVWNNHVSGIYAELIVEGEKVLKTATISLDPWQRGIIDSYWNVTLAPGEYNGKIKLYYAGTYSEKNIKIIVKEPEVRFSLEHVYGIASIGLLILVVILIVIVARLYTKQKDGQKKEVKVSKKKRSKSR